jgi:ribosomal protein S18 acetylase RimI-like enzyme
LSATISVRLAETADASAIIAFDHVARDDAGRVRFIERTIEQRQGYVVTFDNIVAGYGVLNYIFFGNAFIDLLYVSSQYRRRGLGEALMRHMESIREGEKLFTSTNLSNLPMQTLLAKLGYVLSGVIHNLDEGDPELVYLKRLG